MLRRTAWISILLLLLLPALAGETDDAFRDAAREGDVATLKRLHQEGVDVDTPNEYGATALAFACDRGHVEVVKFLLDNGAEVNVQDSFYEMTPLGWALSDDHFEIVELLMGAGATGADQVLMTAVREKNEKLASVALAAEEINSDHVERALKAARETEGAEEIVALLEAAEVTPVEREDVTVSPEVLETYVGSYRSSEIDLVLRFKVDNGVLIGETPDQAFPFRPLTESRFEAVEIPQLKVSFVGRGGMIENALVEQGPTTTSFRRLSADESAAAAAAAAATVEAEGSSATPTEALAPAVAVERKPGQNWPSFRGPAASGVADGQGAVVEWNTEEGTNVRWKTPIPGLGNSSPIVWGKRVFVTTAVSGAQDETFRSGLYGDVDSVDDTSEHEFKVYALDRDSGEIVWEKTAAKAVPGAKRHLKSTQANSTPVTDGKRVVALFGTIGLLVCYDMNGKEKWRTDVGVLDAGWFYDETYQWGHASSPVLYDDLVIVQADLYSDSFIAAWNLKNGKEAWRTARQGAPSWGSPTVYRGAERDELITNATTIRSYDPKTGKELWNLGPNSEVTVATPVVAHDLVYVTAGYSPVRPIYAIRPGKNGDLSLSEGEKASDAVAWSLNRGGTYMPTPIVYGDYLYTCANDGRLTCYEAKTGERVYRARVGGGGTFTASPIAADGRLYFSNEEGDVIVVRAGAEYVELAKNEMGEIIMSTPAVSDGMMIVRTQKHVYGIGAPAKPH